MSGPDQSLPEDGIVVFRLTGEHTFAQAQQRVLVAITATREQGADRMLVDLGQIAGFEPPSLSARHVMVREWAAAADGRLRIALVARPDFIDPEKFGVVSAGNFGLAGNVFISEAEARAWLMQ